MRDYLEIKFWRFAIYIIKSGYGADCLDYDRGCSSCSAKKVVEWIEHHIELIY